MDDLISRQALIRWVATECNPFGKPTIDFESGKKVIEHLETLPSAQPEIILCKDCKRMQEDKIFHQYWCNGNEVKPDHFCGYAERGTDD